MSSRSSNKKISGADVFDAYYHDMFQDRWQQLKDALCAPARQIAWTESMQKPYYLDAGSAAAALSLPFATLPENAQLLDMCAAPGGKTLILSRMLHNNESLHITANERSAERKYRLVRVLDEHVLPQMRNRITVTNRDAARWCRFEPDSCNFILLDAPCSSERHVLTSPSYLNEWTPSRIKTLAIAQWSLLSSAFLTAKEGGVIMYSTCALSSMENDDIIRRLLKKYRNAKILPAELPPAYASLVSVSPEQTEFGRRVMPDTSNGAGPLYYCVIQKTASAQNP